MRPSGTCALGTSTQLAAVAALAALCLGSRGDGVYARITDTLGYALAHATLVATLTVASALCWRSTGRGSVFPKLLLALFLGHPAWWVQPSTDDNDFGRDDDALTFGALAVAILLAQVLYLVPRRVRLVATGAILTAAVGVALYFGMRPDPVPSPDEEALLAAAAFGDTQQVAALLAKGVAVDARRRSQPPTRWEPLYNVCTWLRYPHYPFQHGYTPLMLACIGGHYATAEHLLAHGADPNADLNHGGRFDSPVRFARQYGHPELVALLVRRGAHLGRVRTPLDRG